MAGENPETVTIPIGYTYKYAEKKNEDGTVTKEKKPFFPRTKTSAITNNDNVSLDTILEEIRNFTGYPLTTDITWDKPGMYALDASVGAKYYELCNKVFQSADSSLSDLVSAIGILRNDGDNFSSVLAGMQDTLKNIRQEIISMGGKCADNPTLMQVYEGIKGIQKDTIAYEPFYGEIAISYNEFAKFPNCSVKAGASTAKWKHLAFTDEFLGEHVKKNNGLLDALYNNPFSISQVNISSQYGNFTKKNTLPTYVTYGIEKHYSRNSLLLNDFIANVYVFDASNAISNPCIRYKVTENDETETISYSLYPSIGNSHSRMVTFEKENSETWHKDMSALMCTVPYAELLYCQYHPNCADNPLIGYGNICLSFAFPTNWHTSCYNAEINTWKYYQESPLSGAEKTAWKAEPNIYFTISGYTQVRGK